MPDDLAHRTALVFDLSGSFTFIAEAIRGAFGRVLYASQWETGFSLVRDYLPGVGLDGIERIADPFKVFDECDLVIFPDVGMDGLQEYLRARGMPVWGSGQYGRLERDRIALKEALVALEMDVADYEVITGITALRKRLEEQPDLWIKISYFRGITETKHHKDIDLTEEWLTQKAAILGPYAESMVFLVEEPIDEGDGPVVEVGIDIYAVNGQLPEGALWGYEAKDKAYLGTTGILPARLGDTVNQFMQAMPEYRGPISTEQRTTKDKAFFVDLTARFPSPPSEVACMNIANLANVMYEGARGFLVEPEFRFRYAAQLVMTSDTIEDHPVALKLGMPERTAIHGHCRFEGKDYACSPLKIPECIGAGGLGDSIHDAIAEAIEVAESVESNDVKFDASAFDEILDTIKTGDKLELTFGVFI